MLAAAGTSLFGLGISTSPRPSALWSEVLQLFWFACVPDSGLSLFNVVDVSFLFLGLSHCISSLVWLYAFLVRFDTLSPSIYLYLFFPIYISFLWEKKKSNRGWNSKVCCVKNKRLHSRRSTYWTLSLLISLKSCFRKEWICFQPDCTFLLVNYFWVYLYS